MTLIGFAYGIWPGFPLAVVSSMLGAGIAFVSVRVRHLSSSCLLSGTPSLSRPACDSQISITTYKLTKQRFFPNLIKPNRKWDAFGRVMREKGTVLVCMIRYCPIPWAVGNGLFASIESVKLWQ